MGNTKDIIDYGKIGDSIRLVYKSLGVTPFIGDGAEVCLVDGFARVSVFSKVGNETDEKIGLLKYELDMLSGELAYLVDIMVVSNLVSCILRVDTSEKNLVSEKCRKLTGLGGSKLEIGEKVVESSGVVARDINGTNFYLKLLRDFFCGESRSDMGTKILERFYSSGSNCCLSIDTIPSGYRVFISVEGEIEGTIYFNNDLEITKIAKELLSIRKEEDWLKSLGRVFVSLDANLSCVLSRLNYVKYADWNVERVDLVNVVTVDSITERGCLDCFCYLGSTDGKGNV